MVTIDPNLRPSSDASIVLTNSPRPAAAHRERAYASGHAYAVLISLVRTRYRRVRIDDEPLGPTLNRCVKEKVEQK